MPDHASYNSIYSEREEEERYTAIFNHSIDPIYIQNMEGRFIDANPAALNLLGYTKEELLSLDLEAIFFTREQYEKAVTLNLELVETGTHKNEIIELQLKHKNGTFRWVEITETLLYKDGKPFAMEGIARDITGRKRQEQIQAALYRISEAAHVSQNLNELYVSMTATILELIPVRSIFIALLDESTGLLHFPYHFDGFETDWDPIPTTGKSLTGYVVRTGKPLFATPEVFDRLIESGECELVGKPSIDWLGVPLIGRKRVFGALVVQTYPGDRRLEQADSDILTFVSAQVATAIERRQTEDELRFRNLLLSTQQESAIDGILVLDDKRRVISCNRQFINIWSITPEVLETGSDEVLLESIFHKLADPAAFLKTVQHLYNNPHEVGHQEIILRDGRVIENHSAPMNGSDGKYYGRVLYFRDITARKQAEDEIRSHAERVEVLLRVAERLNTQNQLDALLNIICQETISALNASAANVFLYDEKKKVLYNAADAGFPAGFWKDFTSLQQSSFERVIDTAGTAGIIDLEMVSKFHDKDIFSDQGYRTILYCNISQPDQFIGVLQAFLRDEYHPNLENEITLLKGLADQVAQAIIKGRLFEQVTAGNKHLLELSRQLIDIQEAERHSLALELHDELGQVLNGIKISLDLMTRLPGEMDRKEMLEEARSAVSGLIDRVRQMSLDLRPSLLDEMGLLPTLRWFFRTYQERTHAPVNFEHTGIEQRFPPSVEITAYRIIQESLNNVIRHAKEKKVSVNIWVVDQMLHLSINDEGGGFDVQSVLQKGGSTGLSGMRERARLLGGELVIESTLGGGTSVSASLPLLYSDPESSPLEVS